MPSGNSQLLEAALHLAAAGLPVFPCTSTKAPAIETGHKAATTDPAAIRKLFRASGAALLGIPCGPASGVDLFDLDLPRHEPARAWWREHEARLLKCTRVVRSGGGGVHMLFQHRPGLKCRAHTLARGIDVKTNGGYRIAWAEAHGTEVLNDVPPAPWLDWLFDALLAAQKKTRSTTGATKSATSALSITSPPPKTTPPDRDSRYAEAALDGELRAVRSAVEGQRNDQLNRSAFALGQLVAGGLLDRAGVERELAAVAREAGLSDHEIGATIASGITAGMQQPRTTPAPKTAPRRRAPQAPAESCDAPDQPADRPASWGYWPPGFEARKGGIYRVTESKKDGTPSEFRICAPIEPIAVVRDDAGGGWGLWLQWRDPDGGLHDYVMPFARLSGAGNEIRAELLAGGLQIATHQAARDSLQQWLAAVRPAARARIVHRIGWHQGRAFVLPDSVITAGSGERVLLDSRPQDHAFRTAGTLDAWRVQMARYCIGNTRLVLAVSLAFAPPLLDLAGEEHAGGFHLVGSSRTGKTTALLAAASVWGGGRAGGGFLRSWRHTSNALESTAQQHNDALLVLDELGMMDGREAGEIAYMLAAGSGKGRAAREGGLRATPTWRLLFLSSGEIGLDGKLAEAKQEARAGQAARLVDVQADARLGLGLFETLHDKPDADALARHLRTAAGQCYGTASREFLARLVEARQHDEAGLRDRVAAGREAFFRAAVPADAGGQVRSVAGRFALVAVAGELATEWGITGWPRGEATGAAQVCFAAWLRARGGPGALEELRGLEKVRDFIARHGNARFEVWTDRDRDAPRAQAVDEKGTATPPIERKVVPNRAGWRRWVPDPSAEAGGNWVFYLLPSVFKGEVCAGLDALLVARAMAARGMLHLGPDGKFQGNHRPPGQQTQRLYQLTGFGLSDDDAGPGSDDE